jgi:hypothetical protein
MNNLEAELRGILFVIPDLIGDPDWIPAFAGMTQDQPRSRTARNSFD